MKNKYWAQVYLVRSLGLECIENNDKSTQPHIIQKWWRVITNTKKKYFKIIIWTQLMKNLQTNIYKSNFYNNIIISSHSLFF